MADRPRLREAALGVAVLGLRAPSGYGKSVLASQLVADDEPVAWVRLEHGLDEVEVARCIVTALQPFGVSTDVGSAGLAALGYALAEIAGTGSIVLDDLQRLDEVLADSLVDCLLRHRPPAVRIVLAGWELPLGPLVPAEAAGEALVLEATDLQMTEAECRAVLGERASEIRALTGGWPLAVGMAHTRLSRGLDPFPAGKRDELMAIVINNVDPALVNLLAVLARLGPFRDTEVDVLATGSLGQEYRSFRRDHPALVAPVGEWWRLQDVLAEHLTDRVSDGSIVRPLVEALTLEGQRDRAAEVLAAARQWSELAEYLRHSSRRLIQEGRFGHVRWMVGQLPAGDRPARLELAALRSAMEMAKWDADDQTRNAMTDTITARLAGSTGDEERLIAASILVDHHRYHGDPQVGPVAFEALASWADLDDLPALDAAIASVDREVAAAVADLLGAASLAAGYSGVAAIAERSPDAYRLGATAAARAGTTMEYRAKNLYNQWSLGFEDPAVVIDLLGPVIAELRRTGHPHGVNRLNDRANLLLAVGERLRALRDTAEALDWGERTGNGFGLQTASAIRYLITLLEYGFDRQRQDEGEELWAQVSSSPLQARWLPYYASRMADAAYELDEPDQAERWIERMHQTTLAADAFGRAIGWQLEQVELRRLLRRNQVAEAERRRRALADDVIGAGLVGLERRMAATFAADWLLATGDRDRVQAELDRQHQSPERRLLHTALGHRSEPDDVRVDQLRIETMAPAVSIAWGTEEARTLTGIPAKLLALLVADGGSSNVERCLEVLWPGADPDTARNRFHGVTRRLRRKLGQEPGGALRVVDGVVSLTSTADCELVVDAWQLELGVLDDTADHRDFCSAQFPYDEFAVEARHILRARLDALTAERAVGRAGQDPDDRADEGARSGPTGGRYR